MRLLLPLLLLAACGGSTGSTGSTGQSGDDGASAPSDGASTAGDRPANDLIVEQDLGAGAPPQRWTLVCAGQVEGDHPQAEAACAHLAGMADPFAPLPDDQLCAQVYGGPQTARVTGVWAASPVDLQLSRTDGCRIAQWDSLGPLLPGPVGAGSPQDTPQ